MVEFRYFLSGPTIEGDVPANPVDWISDAAWVVVYRELYGLDKIPRYSGVLEHFMKNPNDWSGVYESETPHLQKFPGKWDRVATQFGRILITKTFRSDRVKSAIRLYIERVKGKQYVEVPVVKLSDCFDKNKPATPIIFILSQGSDPKADFDAFA